jgi:hypothetical protein
MIYILKNENQLFSVDKIQKDFMDEYMKKEKIKQLYLIKTPNEKFSSNNLDQVIDEEVYGVEFELNVENDTDQGVTTPIDVDSQNSIKNANDFACALLKFVHRCDRILKHSENLQKENQHILINSAIMMKQIKFTADENQEILKLIKLRADENHALLQCVVEANNHIKQLHKDVADISGVAKTNQQVLMKLLQVDK